MDSAPPLDELLFAVADMHRRQILVALLDHNPQPVQEVVRGGVSVGEDDERGLQIELYHNHLPRLEDAGFIRWEQAANTVEKGPRFEEIRPLLELLQTHADDLPGSGR